MQCKWLCALRFTRRSQKKQLSSGARACSDITAALVCLLHAVGADDELNRRWQDIYPGSSAIMVIITTACQQALDLSEFDDHLPPVVDDHTSNAISASVSHQPVVCATQQSLQQMVQTTFTLKASLDKESCSKAKDLGQARLVWDTALDTSDT